MFRKTFVGRVFNVSVWFLVCRGKRPRKKKSVPRIKCWFTTCTPFMCSYVFYVRFFIFFIHHSVVPFLKHPCPFIIKRRPLFKNKSLLPHRNTTMWILHRNGFGNNRVGLSSVVHFFRNWSRVCRRENQFRMSEKRFALVYLPGNDVRSYIPAEEIFDFYS